MHEDGRSDRGCSSPEEENISLHNELKALQAKTQELEKQLKSSEQARHWIIKRMEEECASVGIQLLWTDGGGDACPGGWHRNPYINAFSRDSEKRLISKIIKNLLLSRDALCFELTKALNGESHFNNPYVQEPEKRSNLASEMMLLFSLCENVDLDTDSISVMLNAEMAHVEANMK